MKSSNQSITASAQSWLMELDTWIARNGLRGYDPFDVKQHGLVRRAQPYPSMRKSTTVLCDLFPTATRRLLRVAPTENPKAYALLALGKLRFFELTGDEAHLDAAKAALDWLVDHANPDHPGLGWGYPFDVTAKGLVTPKNTPVAVVCAIGGEALLRAADLCGDARYIANARSVAVFLTTGLPFLEQPDGTGSFAYAPTDKRRVHNANLLTAAFLRRLAAVTGEKTGVEQAVRAEAFSLARQRPDGSWPYGEADPSEPYEPSLMNIVDHHHTGFVLRALNDLWQSSTGDPVSAALKRGVRYYRSLFSSSGMPLTAAGRYPVDIHACAEGILCPSVLKDRFPAARGLAPKTVKWTYYHLRRPRDGAPYYRQYPFVRSRLVAPRWGVAWMYWALSEFLIHHLAEASNAEED